MRTFSRILSVAALLLAPTALRAQTPVDLSGHWEGAILAPGMEVSVEIDLTKTGNGELAGTVGQPGQHISGLPLTGFSVDGRSVVFQVKGGAPGQRAFKGEISADGKSISGDYASQFGTLPFQVTRTGDARIEPPSRSAAIGKELEGTWNGTLDIDGGLRIVLTLVNQPDGTATGTFLNLNEGLEIPITAITQKASSVTLEAKGVQSTYSGALNAEGTELTGTFTQGPLSLPLTFRRAAATAPSGPR
jgi:hypothetical protein